MIKHIVHIIDSLELGGAEVLLINSINNLSSHKHTIISLYNKNSFELNTINADVHSLNHTGKKLDLIRCILQLRSLLKSLNPDIVHSHLYWSTIITRLSTPKDIKIVSTYHSLLYDPQNKAQYSAKMLWLDKKTYRNTMHSVFISQAVKKLISEKIGMTQNMTVIPNYINDEFFEQEKPNFKTEDCFRFIAVGNLREEKNYLNLVRAFKELDGSIQLDIVGDGPMSEDIQNLIKEENINNVHLLGKKKNIAKLLTKYHAYTMASSFEGFGIALVEAMAVGLPCIVSDIPTFREIDKNHILFFDQKKPSSIASKIKELSQKSSFDLEALSTELKTISKQYSLSNYIQNLTAVYTN